MTHNEELAELVYHESRLLDAMRLDEWLSLYTDDATYWLPIYEHADPERDSSIIFDDRARLQMRVEQLMRHNRLAQSPQSSCARMISNLSVRLEGDSIARAQYVLLVLETRSGDWRQRGLGLLNQFAGHGELEFVRRGQDWKIRRKKVQLLQRHQPLEGLSFLL